jgi:hypothetical protein
MHSQQSLELTAKQWKPQYALLAVAMKMAGSPAVAVAAVFSKTFLLKFFVTSSSRKIKDCLVQHLGRLRLSCKPTVASSMTHRFIICCVRNTNMLWIRLLTGGSWLPPAEQSPPFEKTYDENASSDEGHNDMMTSMTGLLVSKPRYR